MDVPTGTSTWSGVGGNFAQFVLWRLKSGTALEENNEYEQTKSDFCS